MQQAGSLANSVPEKSPVTVASALNMRLEANHLCNGIQRKSRKQEDMNFLNNSACYGFFSTSRRPSQNVAEKKFAARGVRGGNGSGPNPLHPLSHCNHLFWAEFKSPSVQMRPVANWAADLLSLGQN